MRTEVHEGTQVATDAPCQDCVIRLQCPAVATLAAALRRPHQGTPTRKNVAFTQLNGSYRAPARAPTAHHPTAHTMTLVPPTRRAVHALAESEGGVAFYTSADCREQSSPKKPLKHTHEPDV